MLLIERVRKTGLDTATSTALVPWRKPRTAHDPGKMLLDVALAVALGGGCLADVGVLRAEPAVFGPVGADPKVSRPISKLAPGGQRALTALRTARDEVREHGRRLAGDTAADAGGQVIVDIDGVLVLASPFRFAWLSWWDRGEAVVSVACGRVGMAGARRAGRVLQGSSGRGWSEAVPRFRWLAVAGP